MVKLTLRDKETIQDAVHRFRKLVERSGLKKEMRRREFYSIFQMIINFFRSTTCVRVVLI